jgi:signal transduction histidine kinase
VFITVDANPADPKFCDIWVEDDGMGIPEEARERIFDRGARLDTGKPGTGWALPSCATWPSFTAARSR